MGLPLVAMESSMSTSEPMAAARDSVFDAGWWRGQGKRWTVGRIEGTAVGVKVKVGVEMGACRMGQDGRMRGVCLHHNTEAAA